VERQDEQGPVVDPRRDMKKIGGFEGDMNGIGRLSFQTLIIKRREVPIGKTGEASRMSSNGNKGSNEGGIAAVGIDRQVALWRVGGDAELLKEIAQLFLADYPKSMDDLRLAADNGDANRVERAAHGLKGSVANFGAGAAVEAARTLESMGREQDLREIEQVIRTLELALAALRPELESL
jgi:HPt (histidine-containing phosphotransfer) domain-containing protein